MRAINENTITDAAIEQISSTPTPGIRFDFTLAAAKDEHSARVGADPSQITWKTEAAAD